MLNELFRRIKSRQPDRVIPAVSEESVFRRRPGRDIPLMTREAAEEKFFSTGYWRKQFPRLTEGEIEIILSKNRTLFEAAKVNEHIGAVLEGRFREYLRNRG